MNSPRFRALVIALLLGFSLTACSPQAFTGQVREFQASFSAPFLAEDSPTGTPAARTVEAEIQDVIRRANLHQQEAFADGDPAIMRSTSTDAYFGELERTNRSLRAQGITKMALSDIEWGDVLVTGSAATATTWETWTTELADGGIHRSRDRNVYSLVRVADVWKVQSNEHPDDLASPVQQVEPAVAAPEPAAPPAPLSPRGRGRSSNWSGYAASRGAFTSVTGTWTVPPISNPDGSSSHATWVGIGGERTRDLIQAGTEATVFESGRVRYNAWLEMLPDYARPVPLRVRSGDSVTASIDQQSNDTWIIALHNNSTGDSYRRTVNYESTLSSAEWIQEAPTNSRGALMSLNDFGSVTFTDAFTTVNGELVSVAAAGATPIVMINARGEPIASPSVLTSDGSGFTVTRTQYPAGAGSRRRAPS